jgi:amphi-Trp domain-containing protein
MGREERLFKSEERMSRAQASDVLLRLADKLAEGEIVLRRGEEEVVLQVPEGLVLELQVEDEEKSGGVEHSLEIELTWRDGDTPGGSVEVA